VAVSARGAERLFPDPDAVLRSGFAALGSALEQVCPVPPRHRAALPSAIRQLSALLTCDRAERPPDYLARPRLLAAYLHYYLPWNVYRQARLLRGLPLRLPAGGRIVDLGAGPFTFALALWIARPDLRDEPLVYQAVDRAGSALASGRALLEACAGTACPWRNETRRAEWSAAAANSSDLVVAANLVGELRAATRPGDWAAETLVRMCRPLRPGGRLLLIEPGVRSSARRLHALRAAAAAVGLAPEAPCTHAAVCPLPARRTTGWCHFAPRASGAPAWLREASRRAGLTKERAALSFLLLGEKRGVAAAGGVRIVSGPLELPGQVTGHYACGRGGLVVVRCPRGAATLRPGDHLSADVLAPTGERDVRSGVPVVERRSDRDGPPRRKGLRQR
jgi:hypothetical protein